MPADHWALAMREHDAIMNALLRRDGIALAHILQTHLRNKRRELRAAGFAEDEAASGTARPAAFAHS
jgi:DNA-binding GntR family transcriptional regulator